MSTMTKAEAESRKKASDSAYNAWHRARGARMAAQRVEDAAHNEFIGLFRLHVEAYTELLVLKDKP